MFNIGDIIKAKYTNNEYLQYLVIDVSQKQKKYNTIHLPSGRERPIGFDTAHSEFKISSRACE